MRAEIKTDISDQSLGVRGQVDSGGSVSKDSMVTIHCSLDEKVIKFYLIEFNSLL